MLIIFRDLLRGAYCFQFGLGGARCDRLCYFIAPALRFLGMVQHVFNRCHGFERKLEALVLFAQDADCVEQQLAPGRCSSRSHINRSQVSLRFSGLFAIASNLPVRGC